MLRPLPTAIGAKLYPVILMPLLAAMAARRAGWPQATIFLAASIDQQRAAFSLTRLITAAVFAAIALGVLWRAARRNTVAAFLEAAFLTLAWFWLLAPTQNPWYWTWALPRIPFARSRAWLDLSGLVLLDYLRFWLLYQWPDSSLPGTPYDGARFFDFVVTWFEFALWLCWLAGEFLLRHGRERPQGDQPAQGDQPDAASAGARV